jgi:hypothetical protein
MYYQDVEDKASYYSTKLKADDHRFQKNTLLVHEDGSVFLWRNAFYLKEYEGEWVIVYTEHYGFHVFDADDVDSVTSNEDVIAKVYKSIIGTICDA